MPTGPATLAKGMRAPAWPWAAACLPCGSWAGLGTSLRRCSLPLYNCVAGGTRSCTCSAHWTERLQWRPDQVSPHTLARISVHAPAMHVATANGFCGPLRAPSTACAAGAHAIGEAFAAIREGDADAMVAGGTESCVDVISITGFHRCLQHPEVASWLID